LNNKKVKHSTDGSKRLKLLPLHPIVGLEATIATSTAIIAKHTALQNKQEKGQGLVSSPTGDVFNS
jgi:hypothetical protein